MGYNNIPTKSGHNMFTMASLLQKAARRSDNERSGYAATELFGGYHSVLWNRIMTISAEDCWGVLTKELVYLRAKDIAENKGLSGFEKDPRYVSRAIALICRALKSRDACYFACNFVITPNDREVSVTQQEVDQCYAALMNIGDSIFNIGYLQDTGIENSDELQEIYAEKTKLTLNSIQDSREVAQIGAELQKAIRTLDMYAIGHAVDKLRSYNRTDLWKIILATSVLYTNGELTREIIALKLTDAIVNKGKTAEKKDEIYISKAIILLCYLISGKFDNILSYQRIDYQKLIEWDKYEVKGIYDCKLPYNIVPEWVYDVHTIRGKEAGKTDWDMNLVEQAALTPMQPAFFEEGSWEIRYDYKMKHGITTAREYAACNEYKKTHKANPVEPLADPVSKTDISELDSLSQMIRKCIEVGFLV